MDDASQMGTPSLNSICGRTRVCRGKMSPTADWVGAGIHSGFSKNHSHTHTLHSLPVTLHMYMQIVLWFFIMEGVNSSASIEVSY